MGWTWNPFTDNLDATGPGIGTLTIPEFTTDPSSPISNQAWVLKSGSGGSGGGSPIGLLLALTYASTGGSTTYQFSYQTTEGTTVRTTLS